MPLDTSYESPDRWVNTEAMRCGALAPVPGEEVKLVYFQ